MSHCADPEPCSDRIGSKCPCSTNYIAETAATGDNE